MTAVARKDQKLKKKPPALTEHLRVLQGGGEDVQPKHPCGPVRILLVDDDEDDALLTRTGLLGVNGSFAVDTVHTYNEALTAIRSDRYDAAILDYRLGESTGVALIERCRKAGVKMPMILLTGQGSLDLDLEAMRRGASDYMSKEEMTPAALERSLRYALERAAAEADLITSRRRYEAAVRGSHDGIWDWNMKTEEFYLSSRFKAIIGFEDDEMSNSRLAWFSRVHPEDQSSFEAAIQDHLTGKSPAIAVEYRLQHRDGHWIWVFLRGMAQRDDMGRVERVAGSQSDISDRKLAEQEVTRQALHDPLTGLANRSLLSDRLEHALQRMHREAGFGFAILYLDLDGFKPVNDRHGHPAGDHVLRVFSERLRKTLRKVDCVARVGGDEFVVLLDRCTRPTDAQVVVANLESALTAPVQVGDVEVRIGVSIGVRVVENAGQDPDELLEEADRAMYATKLARRRGDSLRVFPGGRNAKALSLEADLRTALERGNIRPHFQPIVDGATGDPLGFEALARWTDPHRGPISPAEFIPVAERTGLVVELGKVMLGAACAWAASLETEAFVAVNLSPSHVSSPALVEHVEHALAQSGLAPHRLRLELTEHTQLVDEIDAVKSLEKLAGLGVHLDLDDFGTGYSAIDLLLRLPISAIKIDRSLVARVDTDSKKLHILEHLIKLAHAVGKTVTAEGIETEKEWAAARGKNVDTAQGFYFGRPCASPELH